MKIDAILLVLDDAYSRSRSKVILFLPKGWIIISGERQNQNFDKAALLGLNCLNLQKAKYRMH